MSTPHRLAGRAFGSTGDASDAFRSMHRATLRRMPMKLDVVVVTCGALIACGKVNGSEQRVSEASSGGVGGQSPTQGDGNTAMAGGGTSSGGGITSSGGALRATGGGGVMSGGTGSVVAGGAPRPPPPGVCYARQDCAPDEYCSTGGQCEVRGFPTNTFAPGHCEPRPTVEACGDWCYDGGGVYCGCDGLVYCKRCLANRAGWDWTPNWRVCGGQP